MSHEPATKTPSELLYLDDLYVGRRFASGTHALDERQIVAFATEFDPQPFHTDPEAAKGTLFRGLAASGWHTAAITMRLQVDGGLPIAGGIVGLGGEVGWPTATRPGDVLHVESEILDVVPSRLDHYETQYREHILASLRKRAASLGFELVQSPAVSGVVS